MKTSRLEQKIEKYFLDCDATRQQIEQKNGQIATYQRPYTLYGLSAATGIAPQELIRLGSSKGNRGAAAIVANALARTAAYTMEHALLGELTWQVATAALKELGLLGEGGAESVLNVVLDAEANALAM